MSHTTIVILACILLAAFAVPGIVLGLWIGPWFFLLFLGLMFLPLLFIGQGVSE